MNKQKNLTKAEIETLERVIRLAEEALKVGTNFGITSKTLTAIKRSFEIARNDR